MMYRYSVEYARFNCRGNTFVRGEDEKDARSQFKALYPGADIEHMTCLGEASKASGTHAAAGKSEDTHGT